MFIPSYKVQSKPIKLVKFWLSMMKNLTVKLSMDSFWFLDFKEGMSKRFMLITASRRSMKSSPPLIRMILLGFLLSLWIVVCHSWMDMKPPRELEICFWGLILLGKVNQKLLQSQVMLKKSISRRPTCQVWTKSFLSLCQ